MIVKPNNNKEVMLDEVKLKEEINKNDSIAIMLEQSDGTYKESNTFPIHMIFNSEKSGCIDNQGNKLDNSLTYNNGLITIETNKTTYCYIYFDKDKVSPQIFTFYLGGETNPTYVTSASTSISTYLSWSDTDIKEYCLTEDITSDTCVWNEVTSSTTMIGTYTLSGSEGTKTVNAYLKDYAGNISPVVSDTIILDTGTSSFTFYLGGQTNPTYVTSTSTSAYLSWSDTDIKEYCLTTNGNSTNCTWNNVSTSPMTVNYTLSSGLGSKTVNAYLKDYAGNISPVVSDIISLYGIINTIPSQSGTLTYTGGSQTPSWSNYDSNKLTIGGTINGTNAGSYNATFTPKTNYIWSDGSANAKVVSWSMGKAPGSLSVSPTSLTVNIGGTGTITATRTGDGTVSATSSNTSVATVSVSGTTITVTGKSIGSTTITVSVGTGTNHTAPTSKTINVNVPSNLHNKIIQLDNASDIGLQQTYVSIDNLYRFSGTNGNTGINNYICLGATSCASGDETMYRIIGLQPSTGYVKVIKQTTLGTYKWHSSRDSGPLRWHESDLYNLTIKSYVEGLSIYNTKIVQNYTWNVAYVRATSASKTRADVLAQEIKETHAGPAGILSIADYYLAYNADRYWLTDYDTTSNWIGIHNNGGSGYEWSMSWGGGSSTNASWIYTNGKLSSNGANYSANARPTFFLKSDVTWSRGTGTITDPFIIN